MRMSRLIRFLCVLILFSAGSSWADTGSAPQVMVRAHIEPSGPVVAGTQIKLVVDCLTTTWFTEAPDWPLFTVPGAIVSLPDEQAQNLHEVINGADWFGVSRAYRIVPQTAKAFVIPSFAITVQPGQMTGPTTVMTPALQFVATVPAGAEGMSTFFPSQKLVATQKIEPSPEHVRVGGTLTRTITQSAAGTQSMLIPPVNFSDVEGLKRYPKPSTTRDIVQDRAGLIAGERTDTVTYLVDHSGKFKLPAVTIEWWNTGEQRREMIVLPAVSVSAVAATEKPLFEIPVDAMSRGGAHRIIVVDRRELVVGAMILALVLAMFWAYPRLLSVYARARRAALVARHRHAEGAAPAWRALRSAAREGSPQRVIPALYRWMDRSPEFVHPARLDDVGLSSVDGFNPLVDAVQTHYAGHSTAPLERKAVEGALRQAARSARKKRKTRSPLPPLNTY
jgi:hypothetical protein